MDASDAPQRADFAGRTAVVTGGGRGIGAAVATALVEAGARVAVLDRDDADSVGDGADAPPRYKRYRCDVRNPHEVDAAVERAERDLGPVDLLANVAGVLHTGPAVETGDEDWARTFDVNAAGVFHACRAVAPSMMQRGRGAIVTVGSNAAGIPRAGMAAYAASKAAAVMFTKSLGLELAPFGVRCNTVSPGSTDTVMQRSMWADASGRDAVIRGSLEDFKPGIPLGCIAEPSDVAEAVVFLLSDRARHITMQDLQVDGGAALSA